MYFHQR